MPFLSSTISIDPYVLPIKMARTFFLALRGYSPGFRIFPFLKRLTIPNWLSICNARKSPIIHIQILHTELHTFNRSSFYKFPLPFLLVKYWLCEGKIDVDHSWNLRKRAWLPPRAWSQATINAYKAGTNNR